MCRHPRLINKWIQSCKRVHLDANAETPIQITSIHWRHVNHGSRTGNACIRRGYRNVWNYKYETGWISGEVTHGVLDLVLDDVEGVLRGCHALIVIARRSRSRSGIARSGGEIGASYGADLNTSLRPPLARSARFGGTADGEDNGGTQVLFFFRTNNKLFAGPSDLTYMINTTLTNLYGLQNSVLFRPGHIVLSHFASPTLFGRQQRVHSPWHAG
jgi:hypothetical protein